MANLTPDRPPTVSVVVPTYNAPTLLAETLATVFPQTFTDFEVVVIDDGSTDDTPNVLARLAAGEPRLRVVRQANGGIGAARNCGIDVSRGTYIALLDHDDLWHPDKLQEQVDFLRSRPRCVATTCLFCTSDQPGIPRFRKQDVCDADGIVSRPLAIQATGTQLMLSSSLLFVREAATGLRYATRRQCIEDLPFQIGLVGRGAFGVAGGEVRMTYRVHPSNYSKQAAFYFNGTRLLREMDRNGLLGDFWGQDRADLDAYLAYVARWSVFMQVTGGFRRRALSLYLSELPFQTKLRRLRFLALTPALISLPKAVIRRRYRQQATV